MPDIFNYRDYKLFVIDFVKSLESAGRGTFARLAEAAQTHKSTISQIFKGDSHLTCEQAIRVCKFLGLIPKETSFFVLLVNFASAGSHDLRELYKSQIERELDERLQLSTRLKNSYKMGGEQRAIFYSSWIYSAVRVLSSIEKFGSTKAIAVRLNLPIGVVESAVEFLVTSGLCSYKNGKLRPSINSTYLEAKSPLISRHHGNWRVKAMERHPLLGQDELSYTAPVSLSSNDVINIREILAKSVENIDKIIEPSACERMFCLNIDWFEVK